MTDGPHMRKCSACGKVFSGRKNADQHIADKHKGNAVRVSARREDRPNYEPSYADLLIEAHIDRAMGLHIDDDLADVLNEVQP